MTTATKKKTSTKPPKKEEPSRKSVYSQFEGEIIQLVIKPKLDAAVAMMPESISDLSRKFEELTGVKVSETKIKDWMNQLGYSMSRQIVITGFNEPPVLDPEAAPDPTGGTSMFGEVPS